MDALPTVRAACGRTHIGRSAGWWASWSRCAVLLPRAICTAVT